MANELARGFSTIGARYVDFPQVVSRTLPQSDTTTKCGGMEPAKEHALRGFFPRQDWASKFGIPMRTRDLPLPDLHGPVYFRSRKQTVDAMRARFQENFTDSRTPIVQDRLECGNQNQFHLEERPSGPICRRHGLSSLPHRQCLRIVFAWAAWYGTIHQGVPLRCREVEPGSLLQTIGR